MTEEEKKARKKAERERKRNEARENAEKKKRFALTPEKKKKLKLLIMQKAAEDLKNEAQAKAQARKKYLDDNVKPLPDLYSQNEGKKQKKDLLSCLFIHLIRFSNLFLLKPYWCPLQKNCIAK